MLRFLLAASLLVVATAPVSGQQLADLVPPLVSPDDPALEGIILDSVVPLSPALRLGAMRPLPPMPRLERLIPASGLSMDARTGRAFRWSQDFNGNIRVRGTTPRTGSMWYGTLRPNGLMSGFDDDLNFWRYNVKSGIYTNTTTGETCLGRGPTGSC
jgi:hypothetical protein